MTQVGSVYGEALYELACSEDLEKTILDEITALDESFRQEPEFIKLLGSHSIPRNAPRSWTTVFVEKSTSIC